MEVGSREWLIVGAIIVIILIVVDGWRRMRAQSDTLKIDIDDKLSELGDDDYNPELPLGTARVFKGKDEVSGNQQINKTVNELPSSQPIHPKSKLNEQDVNSASVANDKALDESSHSDHSSFSPAIEEPIVSDFADDDLSAVRVVSPPKNARVEPVFEEASFEQSSVEKSSTEQNIEERDESVEKQPDSEVASADEPVSQISESTHDGRSETVDDMSFSAIEEFDQQSVSSQETLVVPDILKKPTQNNVSTEAEKTPELNEKTETSSASKAVASENEAVAVDLEREKAEEKAAKENTDSIVSSLLTTLAQSKKPVSQRESNAESILASHYQERVRREKDSEPVADKFEKLLAEKTAESNFEADERVSVEQELPTPEQDIISDVAAQSEQEAVDEIAVPKNAEQKKDSSDEKSVEDNDEQLEGYTEVTSSETYRQESDQATSSESDEIAIKQKEIDALKAKLEELSAQSDKLETQSEAEVPVSIKSAPLESANDIDLSITTVIDDEVDLQELENDIAKLEDLEPETLQPLLDEAPLDEIEEDIEADPLMDGFNDESASNQLVSQFEDDLEEDQQAVSNELDMPITEILKKQQANANDNSKTVNDSSEEDPLLEEKQLPEDILSAAFDAEESIQNSEQADENDQDYQDFHDGALNESGNLGFNALDQDDSDPLMDDYVDEVVSEPRVVELKTTDIKQADIKHQQKSFFDEDEHESEPNLDRQEPSIAAAATEQVSVKKARKVINNVDDPNAVLIVTVVAKEHYLNGAVLRRVVEACGMEFGDMDVFHRFEDGADSGAVQFSMANAINPGTFDIEQMDDTSTPGVSFFMSMDEPDDAKTALECMLATAETVALHLHGDLLDDDRSVLRPQTKEHYRERVRIHGMNKLRKRAQ